ncbi:YxeA family protein [Paenibacillus bovis]|uniref:YxeA family protein n=1 Tax=Paenibacillus bovis TaxID=1616788 RepID=A0A172ZID2_9BACL|nr:YxeA family protein [Paenibacillus bovis]ANF97293.1 hypothetical protein AR543_15645 [Paenibacillus bovis]
MKKWMISVIVVVIMLIAGVVILQNVNFNRLGTDHYYVQTQGQGKKLEDRTSSGEIYTSYEYTLPASDANGTGMTITFTAAKQLRQGAWLMLYIKDGEVTSYEEVQPADVPAAAQSKLAAGQEGAK